MLFFEIKCSIFESGSNMEIQHDARFLACVFKILIEDLLYNTVLMQFFFSSIN